VQEAGGMMTLTDAFVRVNRARGLELVSPGMANRVAADILLEIRNTELRHINYISQCFRQCFAVIIISEFVRQNC
jgi:hypothetical protein